MFSLSSINAWAVLIRLLHSCVLTILLGNRTPSSLSYAVQINIKQWDITCRNATMSDEIMVFWCWCKLDLMGKGKSAESKKKPTATSSTISSQHKSSFAKAVFSIATGWIWPNKRETEQKFHPIPADKRVLFQQLMSFLLEKCENFRLAQRNKKSFSSRSVFFFSSSSSFLCIWGPFSALVCEDKPGWQNEFWRLIRNSWWEFRQHVYLHGELRGTIPCWCALAERQMQSFFFVVVVFLLLILQRQQIYEIAYSLSG